MATVYAVVSGKGGVGKSTLAANVGAALARMGKRVCLEDMDIGLRSQDVLFGLENKVVYDVVDVLEDVCDLKQALMKTQDGIMLLPAAQTREAGAVSYSGMENLVFQLRRQFDYVLLDAPAGVGRGFQNAICAADNAILVTVPDVVSLRDAERVKGILEREGIAKPLLVLNRVTHVHMNAKAPVSVERCRDVLQMEELGAVPEDTAIGALAAQARLPVNEKTPAGQAFERIARRLTGSAVPIVYPQKKGFFRRLFSRE